MLANFFGKSKPVNFIVLFGLLLCYVVFTSIITYNTSINESFSFGKILFVFLYLLLLLFFTNFIIKKNKLTFDSSYALFFFIVLLGFFPNVLLLSNIFYANFFILLFLRKVYSLKNNTTIYKKLFDSGFWLAIAFLIEPFLLVFFVLLYYAVDTYQKITIERLLIPLVGFSIPISLFFTYSFWNDDLSYFNNFFKWVTTYDFSQYLEFNYLISIIFIVLLTIVSFVLKTPKALAVKNTFRKSWFVLLVHFLVALTLCVFIKNKNGQEFLYLLLPIAIILANGLEALENRLIKEVVLLFFLFLSITVNFL